MPRRKAKLGKRKRGRGKRRLFRRKGRKGRKLGKSGAIKMLGTSSFFPRRQVVKGAVKGDWQGIGLGAGVIISYPIAANSTLTPLLAVTGETTSFGGLATLLHSVEGTSASIYNWYRILHSTITVEVMSLDVASTHGIEFFIYPHNETVSSAAASMDEVMQRQYVKTCSIWPGSNRPTKITNSMNIRKFLGKNKAAYSQDEFYGAAANDPATVCRWIVGYQPVPNFVLPANLYAWRFSMTAIIELTEPFDAYSSQPT